MADSRTPPEAGDRLAKVIARSGLCSRRDAESWISAGRVVVNGKTVKTLAFNVTDRDKIEVDGKPLPERQGTRLWLYHKPPGLVVTEKDPEGRETIFEVLEKQGLPRVLTVGRLDINTEGLLLLTNDGGLKRVLELPATGWLRRYRVRAFGTVTQAALDRLADGIELDGVNYGPIEAVLEREQGANNWLIIGLREGKNREVKNVLGALGLEVNRLIRISYGPFQLGDLPVGAVEAVRSRVLRDQLGTKLAEAAGADFESEMPEAGSARGQPPRDPRGGSGVARGERRFTPAGRGAAGRGSRDAPAGPVRKIHFDQSYDEGRQSEEFVQKPSGKGKRRDDGPPGRGGPPRSLGGDDARPGRGAPTRKPFGSDGPKRSFADRPDRSEGAPRRGPGAGPSAGRPVGGGFKPRGEGGERGETRGFADRPKPGPKRSFAEGGPGAKRPFGGGSKPGPKRSFSGGRPEGTGGARGERPARPPFRRNDDLAGGGAPARGPRADRGDRPPRPDGAAGQSRPDRAGRPPRTAGPGRSDRAGPRPGGARPPRAEGAPPRSGKPFGRPGGGSRPPAGGKPRPPGGAPRGPRRPPPRP